MSKHLSSEPLQILAISGSLRAASSNTALLQAAQTLAPQGVAISLFDGVGDLPHFNPDLDGVQAPTSVQEFRARLRDADGVLFCSPEYAHGVPGALKNALDWIVGSGELMEKPVALFKASAHGTYAQASLQETLSVMTAQVIEEASLVVALGSNKITATEIASDEAASQTLRLALSALVRAIEATRVESGNCTKWNAPDILLERACQMASLRGCRGTLFATENRQFNIRARIWPRPFSCEENT